MNKVHCPLCNSQNTSLIETINVSEIVSQCMRSFGIIKNIFRQVGFVDIRRMAASSFNIQSFPCNPLDVSEDGEPRKGKESMFVEAVNP